MRSPRLGLLALLGLFTYSCVSPFGMTPGSTQGTASKRPARPKVEATRSPTPSATPTRPSATPTPAPEATATPASEDYFALVRDASGNPVRGATVKVYLATGIAPIKSVTTDADGRFDLAGNALWPVNLEVVGPIGGKAYRARVAADTRKLEIALASPGKLTGSVKAPSLTAAPDFSDLTVRVLGTSYSATPAADGTFEFEALPAGSYRLVGEGPLLGELTPVEVAVESGKTVAAADMTVSPTPPQIASLTPANGGPGHTVMIQGTGFGRTADLPFSVRFGGALVQAPVRQSDTLIEATVPATAANGDVVVTLGGKLPSAGRPFRVIERLAITPATAAMTVGQEQSFVAEARDTADAVIGAPALSGWSSSDPAVAEVDASGTVTAKAPGQAVLTVKSGTVEATRALTISAP